MAKDGFSLIIPLALLAGLCFFFNWRIPGVLFVALALFVAYFFRDPERTIPADPAIIVSPADGRVVEILPAGTTPAGGTRIGIFLSPLDVHINRSPIAGRITRIEYKPGKFLPAFNPAAATENEQNILTIDNGTYQMIVKQIAGVLARRIVCWKHEGDVIGKGERFGLIKFGSRVEMVLPAEVEVSIKVGDTIKGGASIIGKYHGKTK